jgi:ADP-ribose pyrophosphatase YjhB (NUDIX family)
MMKFCSDCGAGIEYRIPEGDDRERAVCTRCEAIHYVNPRLIVGCVPEFEGRILLCLRSIEPRSGYWTLPAGFMENGETTEQGAARETWEEARARVEQLSLYRVYDVPYINQVYFFYRCQVVEGVHAAGPESRDTQLFAPQDIPWDELAFPSVFRALRAYLDDREAGNGFPVRVETILRRRDAGG